MLHISHTILKESEEVVNLVLLKTSNCNFRNLVRVQTSRCKPV